MKVTDLPTFPPHRCAVLPYMAGSNSRGFFDTGMFLDRQRVYVSFEAVCEMARELGWSGPQAAREKDARIAELEAEADDLRAQLQEADKFAEAAEYSLARFGQKVQKKPGRPKKEAVA